MNPIVVNVIRVPGRSQQAYLEEGATVGDAISAIGESVASTESVKFSNGNVAALSDSVNSGDRLIIAKGAKGNS